jgi:hypothetical protein
MLHDESRARVTLTSALAFCFLVTAFCSAEEQLTTKCTLYFASVEQGQQALVADDAFTRNLSRFDLQARLGTTKEVTIDDWKRFAAGEVRKWTDDGRARIEEALETLRPKLAELRLPLPERIGLVLTTGKEESGAAYCRGAFIVLPEKVLQREKSQLVSLLAHELFHVISNQNPKLRDPLYAIVGFQHCEPIAIHPSLKDRRITNPDAPRIDCVVKLQEGERTVRAAPVLYSAFSAFDPEKPGGLFSQMLFRLMLVQPDGQGWKAIDQASKAVVVDPKGVPDFQEKIGRNTNYIVHPEEILADNFVHLVRGKTDLPTPRIVEELRKVLEEAER